MVLRVPRRCCSVTISVYLFLILLLVIVNIYFFYEIMEEKYVSSNTEQKITGTTSSTAYLSNVKPKSSRRQGKFYLAQGKSQLIASNTAAKKIQKAVTELLPSYKNTTKSYKNVHMKILRSLQTSLKPSSDLWKLTESWATGLQILPENSPILGSLLNTLSSAKIIKAENSKKGTQLKILVTLEGGQLALFKPQWYQRDEIIEDPVVYGGHDRHNAEIVAFYLSLLLDIRRVPITVGRRVNLRREIMPVSSPQLLDTFYQEGNNTCFYGVCSFCTPQEPVCAKNDIMDGAVIMWLQPDLRFEKFSSPWQRSYYKNYVASWEVEEGYCEKIKNTKRYSLKNSNLLLDFVDAAILDFLIDNGDRHHYEVPINREPATFYLFDNGKGLANPSNDHLDILAPLYQCCILRKKTWERLKIFTGGALSSSLEQALKVTHVAPVISSAHLLAIDRRLLSIFAAVEVCIRENGITKVLL